MSAVWMRLRSELRARWRAWIALALLFGLASGTTIAAVAGARRTETAYPRFLRAQDGFHAVTGGGAENNFENAFEAIKNLPMVEDHVELIIVGGGATMPAKRGRPEQEVTFPEIIVVSDPSGRALYETNRAKVLRGRLANRARVDETTVPFTLAERYDLEIGDRITVGVGFNLDRFPESIERLALRIVGIVASPGDFEAVGQAAFLSVYATPALFRAYHDKILDLNPETWNLGVHLRGGPAAATAFKQKIESEFDIDVPIIEPVIRSGVQKTMRLYSAALWLVAALVAAATITVLGQTIVRQQTLDASEYPVLRAFGASRRQFVTLGLVRAGLIGFVAAGTAMLVAFLLSPLAPIGTARIAEPDPGLAFDATALWFGAAATLLAVPIVALIPAFRSARAAALDGRSLRAGPARPSWIVTTASRTSRSPAAAAGLRMALEPGFGSTAVPVRSTILAVALGVAALTGALVVGRSLSHLVATPALAGFTYDAIIPEESEEPDPARPQQLRAFPFVEQLTAGTGLNAVFKGVDSFIVGFEQDNPIGFAIIEGRSPTDAGNGPPEIALGPGTMRRMDLDLGDTTEFLFAAEEGEGDFIRTSTKVRVVGVAAIPPLPWAAIEPGEGAVMTIGAIARVSPHDQGGCCFVRFKQGTDLAAARESLEEAGFETFLRTKRSDLATLERISRLPLFLTLIFGAIAAAALGHVLVTGIRRRRRDLAILKTLGFVNRQVRSTVAWQASAVALVSAIVGIPAGIVLGRWGWRLVAGQFGVVPVSIVPALFLALVIPAGLLLANLVAAIPGRVAARTQPAIVLRTE